MKTNRFIRSFASLLTLAALLAGCGSGDDPEETAPNSNNGDTGRIEERPGSGTGDAPDTDTGGLAGTPQTFIDQALAQINTARRNQQQCGDEAMPPQNAVRWDSRIEQAVLNHSQWMQQTNTFSHTGANGSDTGDRLSATGYDWRIVAENIAAGYPDLNAVVSAWLDSPTHCTAIMNGSVVEMAVRKVDGASGNEYNNYWTLVLAAPR